MKNKKIVIQIVSFGPLSIHCLVKTCNSIKRFNYKIKKSLINMIAFVIKGCVISRIEQKL